MIKLIILILLIYSKCISQEGWYELNSPTKNDIREIHFYDENLGMICDFENVFLTQDGGKTFKALNSNIENSKLYSAIILDKNTIAVSGYDIKDKLYLNFVKKTNDFGNTWEYLYEESYVKIYYLSNLRLFNNKIAFSSRNRGINNDLS
ncbi:MAG: hypothetical protein NTW25_16575 [Candidatus Kapabacteria bacterium]|nr:hypothetical protein [Candidatus Kapabacteria bacterium]